MVIVRALYRICLALGFAGIAMIIPAFGAELIYSGELRLWQEEGRPVLVVDVRPALLFKQSHIEGAINVPAFAVGRKPLPAERSIVFYDEGIGSTTAEEAAERIAGTTMSPVFVLDGGLAGWEAEGQVRVGQRGVLKEPLIRPISARDLARARQKGKDVIVIDLRNEPGPTRRNIQGSRKIPPGQVVSRSAGWRKDQLVVLVDNDDGSAKEEAEKLRRKGFRMIRYLYGGYPEWERLNTAQP